MGQNFKVLLLWLRVQIKIINFTRLFSKFQKIRYHVFGLLFQQQVSSQSAVYRSITLYHFAKRKLNSHENKQQKKGSFFAVIYKKNLLCPMTKKICQHHPMGRPHTEEKLEGFKTQKKFLCPCTSIFIYFFAKRLRKKVVVSWQRQFLTFS